MSSSHAHSHGRKDAAHHGIPVITIDGPTASGKGTVAARVAQRLGFHYLDSGVLYRLVAMKLVQEGEDGANEDAAVRAAQTLEPEFLPDGRIMLSGEDVSAAIRADGIGLQASRLAVHPAVREALNVLQHRARKAPGLVADGRDMGTVVFADAPLKVFLTASAETRAERRYKQLAAKGISANIARLRDDLQARDARDASRAAAPLKAAQDALALDNSCLSIEQSVQQVLDWWQDRQPF